MKVPRIVGLMLAWCLLLVPSAVDAQVVSGTVAGTARDTSGAVLPGVTVEAASPALIEKVRSVVTDSQGLYRIVDLRPGTYTVTFTLPGFTTFKREGVEVTTGFTATVNGEMTVGAIEETITVSGVAPVVDTQNIRSQSTIQRETMDALPTTGRIAQLVTLIPGATSGSASNHDVGGVGSDRGQIAVHGQNSGDMNINLGGMDQRVRSGGSLALNVHLFQEVTIETGGFSAQAETGGIQVNVVPKDGGNRFSGTFSSVHTHPNLQSENITDELRARGLNSAPGMRHMYDTGGGIGGAILRDRLWFFGAARYLDKSQYQQGNYFNKVELQDAPGLSTDPVWRVVAYEPDLSRAAFSWDYGRDVSVVLTGQVGKHKISVSHSQQPTCQCSYGLLESGVGGEILIAPEASGQHHYNPQFMPILRYTYPATNRLLIEGGASMNMYGGNSKRQQYDDGNKRVAGDIIAITDVERNLRYGARATNLGNLGGSYTRLPIKIVQQRFAVSYITGSHSFKTGIDTAQFRTGTFDAADDPNQINGARDYTFRNGVPTNVRIWAAPFEFEESARDIAIFVQDQWTIRRLTVNAGVRWNNFNGSAAPVTLPAGPWVPAREYPGLEDAPNWTNLNPRGGVAYDLFGDGRTALKIALGRFSSRLRDSVAGPARSQIHNTNRTWNDANRNFVPDCDLLNPVANGECGAWNNLLFGQRGAVTTRNAEDSLEGFNKQSNNWQASISAQHELRSGIGLNVAYYRTWFGGFLTTDNLALTPADYDEYCITVPTDSRLPNSGQQLCGLYDLKPEKFGLQDNLVTQKSHYGKQTEIYNGFDVTLQSRFGSGGQLGGGVSVGRTATDNCIVVDSPQDAREGFCSVTPPWSSGTQFKLMAVYPLPWDLQTSIIYQNIALDPVIANLVVNNAQIAPSLGRNLGACRGAVTCNANVTVPLIPSGSLFDERLQQLDLRFSKFVPLQGVRLKGSVDLYNFFNASSVLAQTVTYGRTWRQPLQIMGGRMLKFTISADF